MLRRLGWLILGFAVIWCAWWALATTGVSRSLAGWFEDRRAEGWQAEVTDLSSHGFPTTLHATLEGVALADPLSGLGIALPRLDLMAPAWWPGYVTLRLPDTPVVLMGPGGRITLHATDAQAEMRVRPGTALAFQTLSLTSGPWTVDAPDGGLMEAEGLRMAVTQDTADRQTYHFVVAAEALTPGSVARTTLGLTDDWPAAFDMFAASLSVTFDAPWDRYALEQRRPQPREITLRGVEAAWGDLRVLATGQLSVDAMGVPEGAVTLKARNWPKMLELAETAGVVQGGLRPQVETVLRALANLGDDPDALDLTLRFQDGQMALEQIVLGPAPRLILR